MASSALTYSRRYHVFPNFHGQDVRRTFLSHLHREFVSKGIVVFKDKEIERSHTIGHDLIQAIRESRISIVVLSKNYASSGWCLDELVEIFKCKEDQGQVVMTVFYDVNPSDVRKQSGNFGRAFETTCQKKAEKVKQRWTKALTDVADIAGEHYLNWDDEGKMVEKIASDVSKKLNLTIVSRDFEGMVGMEAHLRKLDSLLCLECDEVKMIGVWGPAGIGKTTIARALFNKLSNNFGLSCFMGNLEGGLMKSIRGVDDYASKLCLQSQFLSEMLNQKDMKIRHLGAVKEWLQDKKVLIVLDGVDDLEQLVVLANEPSWFGSGSRIIVTTEDKKILTAHGINIIYNVDFPYEEEALEIFCLSAFKQKSPQDGFEKLAKKAAKICGNLPLGLCVVGSSLRGVTKSEWELQLSGIENSLDRKIEDVLRVGYDKLSKKHQVIFLHIACFFNNENVDHVTAMLADGNLDFTNGLKILADKSLVHISTDGKIVMHYLLQQMGREEVVKHSNEPGKRHFLVEAQDILNVLSNGTGTESVVGISFDTSKIGELFIHRRAFERMHNLQFLRVYRSHSNENLSVCTIEGMDYLPRLEDMEFLPRLRLLDWNSYPGKSLPQSLRPEFLIKLNMPSGKFEKLWGGIQPLVNLRKVNLNFCFKLKEIPNLSRATNLETLTFIQCTNLVKFPSSIVNLYKLTIVRMWGCNNLQVVPTDTNLKHNINRRCTSTILRSFPDITRNINNLWIRGSPFVGRNRNRDFKRLPHVPESVWNYEDLSRSDMERIPAYVRPHTFINKNCTKQRPNVVSRELQRLTTHVPQRLSKLDLSGSGIERIPDYLSGLHRLETLILENCTKLISVEGLPSSLKYLHANGCVSLERVKFSMLLQDSDSVRELFFRNCLRLDEEARREIINHRFAKYVCLPGKQVPLEFTHKATSTYITISQGNFCTASSRFKACVRYDSIKDHTLFSIYIIKVEVQIGDVWKQGY
ncbi:disease resistance protein RML1A-like [Raphanus sativus]|uniref:ADP-ribosyl cyclase/cyclic ADP-ribose hydrolase n=1 Tax=Raphanus sativus TaxID=3726 RepID=A0A9W3DLZ3_RAPSA|nr:disease resistance protein RML1A-like [Raphanus sativus]